MLFEINYSEFEDKWALMFLILIPIIEIIRNLILNYGQPKLLKLFETRWYNVMLPPTPIQTTHDKTTRISIWPNSAIFKKIFSLKFLKLCSRRKSSTQRISNMENVSLLSNDKLEIQVNINEDTDIELGIPNDVSSTHKSSSIKKLLQTRKSTTSSSSLSSISKLNIKSKLNMDSLNTYDIFKVISTITMFIDHYGYFGLPGLDFKQQSWSRVIGRTAAPGFFFLSGYSSKKFRMRTWCAALFLYICTSVLPLNIVHSPWESIMNVLLMNCILFYIPPHRIRNPLIHLLIFIILQYYRSYASRELNIGYGTIPIMLGIAGDLLRYKHYMAPLWIIAGMTSFGYSSINVFSRNNYHTTVIILESILNALMMLFFKIIEIPILNKLCITRYLVRDGLIWLSRAGLLVYCGHLCIFRLIQLAYYAGNFNHMYY